MRISDFITHYSRVEPFRSMTSIPLEKRLEILKELNETTAWGIARFSDPEYLERRLTVEKQMRRKFIAKGGEPVLEQPIYFFLGRDHQFEKYERNLGYMIYLKNISPDSISFTYGDSMLAYNEDYRDKSGEKYKNNLCAKIFLVHELEDLFLNIDFPQSDPLRVEAQLWVTPKKEIVKYLER